MKEERSSFLFLLPEILVQEVELGRAAVVGGAVRAHFENRAPRDIDVFVFNKDRHESLADRLRAYPMPETEGAVFFLPGEIPVELVCLPGWDSPLACLERADFNVSAGIYSAGQFFCPEGYEGAVKKRMMRFLGKTENPQRSYGRFLKYNREYGYRIDDSIQDLLRLWQAGY